MTPALDGLLDALPPWARAPALLLALLAVAGVAGWLFERVVVAAAKRMVARTSTEADDLVVRALHPAVAVLVVVAVLMAGLHALRGHLPEAASAWWSRIVLAVGIAVAAILVARVLGGLMQHWGRRRARWQPVTRLGSRIGNVLVYVLAFLVILDSYGVSITPIITSLGIAGLAVALALQDTLANVFSGIWIQTQRSVDPGHYVRLEGEGLEGFVVEVGWRTTKLRTLPGNLVVIPNQTVAKATVTDYWLPEPKMGTSITLTTTFHADPERVVPLLLEEVLAASREVPFILETPAPSARLNKATATGWEFWLGFWTPHHYDQWNAQGYVWNRVRKRFAAERIHFAVPLTQLAMAPDGGDGPGLGTPGPAVAQGRRDEHGRVVVSPPS